MSDERPAGDGNAEATRRATVTTTHDDAATAERVAAALRPDNTAEMSTRTDGSQVVTTVGRDSTGGLASTLDDYVVNATVATRLTTDDARRGGVHDSDTRDSRHESDTRDSRHSDTRDSRHSDTSTS